MKAYKVVREIDNKLYSSMASPHFLIFEIKNGLVVEYGLNKRTTYKRNGAGNNFLYCFSSLKEASVYKQYGFSIFECDIVKSKSKTEVYGAGVIKASSVILRKRVYW